MKTPIAQIAVILSLAAVLSCRAEEPKFQPLFNGKDLTNFKAADAKPFWRVEDGVLIGENDAAKKGSYLFTEKEYRRLCH